MITLFTIVALLTPPQAPVQFSADRLVIELDSGACDGQQIRLVKPTVQHRTASIQAEQVRWCEHRQQLTGRELKLSFPGLFATSLGGVAKLSDGRVSTLHLKHGQLTTCTCTDPPWVVSFERADLVGDNTIRVTWPTFRAYGLPIATLPFWTIRTDGRPSGFGIPKLSWNPTRGLRYGLPLTWPVGDTTSVRLEMGQDGIDQYATAKVSAPGSLGEENSLTLGMTGSVLDLNGRGAFNRGRHALSYHLGWSNQPLAQRHLSRDWRAHIAREWLSSMAYVNQSDNLIVGARLDVAQRPHAAPPNSDSALATTFVSWLWSMPSITSAVTATTHLLEQRGVRHGTTSLGLNAEYNGHFTGLAIESTTDSVYMASMSGERTQDSFAIGTTLYPALHIMGRIGRAKHSLQFGPDSWTVRPLESIANPLLEAYTEGVWRTGAGLRLKQTLKTQHGMSRLDIRGDIWRSDDAAGAVNVLATHTTGTVTGHIETIGADWLQSDVQTSVNEQISAGLTVSTFGAHTPEAEYRLGGYDILRRTRLVLDSASGIGPRLDLRLSQLTITTRSLWRMHAPTWIGAETTARIEHRCRCLGLDLSLNQHRSMRYPNAFLSFRLGAQPSAQGENFY